MEGIHTLQNQLIMGLVFQELVGAKTSMKLNLITTSKKMMNFYRYELMKTEKFIIGDIGY